MPIPDFQTIMLPLLRFSGSPNMSKALALFLTCALSPLLALADATFDAYKAKAEKGDAEAQLNVAGCYANGIGVIKDELKAVEWFEKSATQGNGKAQASLGVYYLVNSTTPDRFPKALEWLQKGANQGIGMAQAYLGVCYHEGYGTKKDGLKAVEWFKKAAAQGLDVAQHALAKCYLDGSGTAKSDLKAHVWFSLYAAQEHIHVAQGQNESVRGTILMIEKRMTQEQVAEAQKLSVTYAELIKQGKPLPTQ
jgi:TPR repeat protein